MKNRHEIFYTYSFKMLKSIKINEKITSTSRLEIFLLIKPIASCKYSLQIYVKMEVSVSSQRLEHTVRRNTMMDTPAVNSIQIYQ